ncbi:hypothetical protein [Methylomagnum ishizawai]|uniref:hypothetical protein n=1 Tax=Methylomagnum ishizawai TaxID=1760988 RepID=UPI001C32529D|nr:hypothetical protein [Methylomagnum ishizawai]BBL74021.1 hypothetical protein MishRS11D_11190 [Methylomagnum ishizawai]
MNILMKSGLSLAAALALYCGSAPASEYIYRDLLGNTLASRQCAAKPDAEQRASDAYTIGKFAKRFCETQGYGWYVSEQKAPGKLVCEPCAGTDAGYRCHVEDVEVSCKRLKPGSAGLIPGKS